MERSTERATAMRDSQGRSIAPFDLWQGSNMANASRDPLWRAAMSAETAATPLAKEFIESKCLSCHAPAGWREAAQKDARILTAANKVGMLARDGANCTTCHQIAPDNLDTEASFDGSGTVQVFLEQTCFTKLVIFYLQRAHCLPPDRFQNHFLPKCFMLRLKPRLFALWFC